MRSLIRAVVLLSALRPASSHWHEKWEEGITFGYRWFDQNWVRTVREFYCDAVCDERLKVRNRRRISFFTPPIHSRSHPSPAIFILAGRDDHRQGV